jgi:hypothetical protein
MQRNIKHPDEDPAVESISGVQKYRKIRTKMVGAIDSNGAMIHQ